VANEHGSTSPGGETGDGWAERLCHDLGAVIAELDPVPPEVLRDARAAYDLRTIDAELATLANDSVLDRQPAGVRGAEGPRSLTFEAPGLTVEVEVTVLGPRRRLIGQLVPPSRAKVTVRHGGGAVEVDADELGRFRADDLPSGRVSLRCDLLAEGGEGATVTTAPTGPVLTVWIAI
jgi:hypothetical protein